MENTKKMKINEICPKFAVRTKYTYCCCFKWFSFRVQYKMSLAW